MDAGGTDTSFTTPAGLFDPTAAPYNALVTADSDLAFSLEVNLGAGTVLGAFDIDNASGIGSFVERIVGPWRFLLLFVLAAAAGALAHLASNPVGEGGLMIGASGAVYGYLGAAVPFLFARPRTAAGEGFGRGLNFVVVVMLLNIGFAWANNAWDLLGEKIAWQAHIGGFVVGLLFGALVWGMTRSRRSGL